MSHSNHQRRRSRTFRVEVLESRTLLSTAGVVSRPGAAVAPLARVAQFSKIGGDPKFEGQLKGTFRVTEGGRFEFTASGYLSGKPFGNLSEFAGTAHTGKTSGGKTTYTSGAGTITNQSGTNQLIVQSFKVTVHGTKFAISGTTGLGVGDLKGVKKGKIDGHGSIDRATGSIHVDITVEVP
jgi:hypothetical protein